MSLGSLHTIVCWHVLISKGILKTSGNKFLTMKFLRHYISKGVYYHCTKDLFATPEGKPVAAAGSCGHRKTTAKIFRTL